jgi:hypothetical protein
MMTIKRILRALPQFGKKKSGPQLAGLMNLTRSLPAVPAVTVPPMMVPTHFGHALL